MCGIVVVLKRPRNLTCGTSFCLVGSCKTNFNERGLHFRDFFEKLNGNNLGKDSFLNIENSSFYKLPRLLQMDVSSIISSIFSKNISWDLIVVDYSDWRIGN